MLTLILSLCGAFYVGAPQANAAPTPITGIFGRVLNAETHEPIRRAVIKVYTPKEEWDEVTGAEGRFKFPDLARNEYSLIAHRDGYTDRSYIVERSDFDELKELPIELQPQAVIAGRVVDSFGQPLQSAQIQALRTVRGSIEMAGSTETNDLGAYRLSGLDPWSYRLRAVYREGRAGEFDSTPLTIASAYYGNPEKPAEVAVKAGSLAGGIDFVLNAVRPVTVRGTLHTETGIPAETAELWITGQAGEGGHNGTGKDGKFEIADVGPGTYTISAKISNSASPMFAIATVEVRGEDVTGVELILRPIPKIDTEVRIEGDLPEDFKLSNIMFMRTDRVTVTSMEIGHLDAKRKFTIALIPGEYVFTFDMPTANVDVQEVTFNGQPVTDWKLQVDASPETKKLLIVLRAKPR